MIQDIAPHVFYNQYKNLTAQPEDMAVIMDSRNLLLVKPDGDAVKYPTFAELAPLGVNTENATYLFAVDDMNFFLIDTDVKPEGYEFTDIHRTYSGEYGWITLVAATAIHLRAW
ncbi:MAG: hypothetical protein KBS66_05870, partial [Eubacterium sp.]|nr:hypothetical protein [Candidatus Colimonas fimequi]